MDAHLAHVFKSIAELKSQSSVIIVGTVASQATQAMSYGPVTMSTMHVDAVLWSKGSTNVGTSVIAWQVGGKTADGTTYLMDDAPIFAGGSRYVLFLTPAPNAGDFWVTGVFQGAFALDQHGNVSSYSHASMSVGVYIHDVALADFAGRVQAA